MTNIMLEVKNLKKIYDELGPSPKIALDDLSFEIKNNEFVCIMGPSGSGKTTLVNILSTIDKATSGIVNISGASIVGMSGAVKAKFRKKKLGFIFQNYNLLDTLTVKENIVLPLRLSKVTVEQNKFERIVKELEIKEVLNKYPFECSGGQLQRVAVARTLIMNPKIIFADEPTGNLDGVRSKQLMQYLEKINKNRNITIVMVTHDPLDAAYSSQMYYIEDGKIKNHIIKGDDTFEEYFSKIVKISMEL